MITLLVILAALTTYLLLDAAVERADAVGWDARALAYFIVGLVSSLTIFVVYHTHAGT